MLDAIKRLLAGAVPPPPRIGAAPAPAPAPAADNQRIQVAACALLLELAHADGEFGDEERRHIEEVLARHFDLSAEDARDLMAEAADERGKAIDLHEFTSVLTRSYDEGQRMTLAEVLWRVVYADGELSRHEDYLMRKLASLLELRPGYLNAARARAVPGKDSKEGER
jgi:uncharacterized tellurite resistance protein B-like protein